MENLFKMDDLGVPLFLDNTQVALMAIFIHHCLLIQLMVNWWCGALGGLDSDWIPGKGQGIGIFFCVRRFRAPNQQLSAENNKIEENKNPQGSPR